MHASCLHNENSSVGLARGSPEGASGLRREEGTIRKAIGLRMLVRVACLFMSYNALLLKTRPNIQINT